MDPFSLVAGTTSVVDVLLRFGSYLKHIHDAAGTIDEDIAALIHEIDALISVNTSIEDTSKIEQARIPSSSLADLNRLEGLWRSVGVLRKDCQTTVERLQAVVQGIFGKEGTPKSTGKVDALKRTLRKDKKIDEIKDLRLQLTNYKNSLQVLLTALNLCVNSYTRNSQDSTDVSLGHLSQEVQLLGFKLNHQLASLRPQLATATDRHFLRAIKPATVVASLVSINRHFDIPQTVSSIFTGRDSLLEDLQTAFDVFETSREPRKVQRRFIVYGLGGSGKTQFCCKFAQDNRNNFWGVFCVDASSVQAAEHSFSQIVKFGGRQPSEGSNQRAAKEWLSSLDEPWLLIIDNADDSSYPLEDYFPRGERGCILVTTRVPAYKVHGTVGTGSYRFDQLAIDEANDLLLKAAGKPSPWDTSTRSAAELIADVLGFLPLALIHAGKAIMNGLCSLANYVEYYNKSWERIRQARRNSGYRGDIDRNMNVYSSYEINLRSLEESDTEQSIDALQLLKMFSCLHNENIRVDVIITAALNPQVEREQQRKDAESQARTKAASRPKTTSELIRDKMFRVLEFLLRDRSPPVLPALLRECKPLSSFADLLEIRLRHALKVLSQMSLITHHEATDNYSMHLLVHTWVRERPEMSVAEQALWCQAAKTMLAQCILLPPHGSSEKEEAMRRSLLPQVNYVRKCEAIINTKINEAQKSRPWYRGFPVPQNKFGRRQALECAKFSRVYFEFGLWKEAEELQVAVKDFVCSMLGAGHPIALKATLFLSATYFSQTRHNDAAELQCQVFQACERSLGSDHPETHKYMDILASSRCFQGRFKEALELHERAIAGMKRTPPTNPEDIFIAIGNLGRVLWRYFRYKDAMDLHKDAVEGLTKTLGPTHLQTLLGKEDLAMSYLDCGEDLLDPARKLMLEVLDQRKKRLGGEQPFTLLAICNLARVESACGNNDEAEKLFRETIPIAERTLGENHYGTLAAKVHFAIVLTRQKKYDEAEEVFTKVVERHRYESAARADGDHPDRIFALWHLVLCYELHGKVDDALLRVMELETVLTTIGGQGLGKLHPFAKRLQDKRAELETAQKAPQENIQPDVPERVDSQESAPGFASSDTLVSSPPLSPPLVEMPE
ncbi:uncharacterized protein BDZ99DRAFT_374465 [Mytilinidion resinicola]|uniref:TPR-like protein n=1 Tax=Mytilinidion resinicola TaxID=574789 RepID=A0A6A6ZAX3_9PEZI|nr:uncharacterized protein BDZ99DRAFT_374465 [Mytilinidion resinicola]KAF2817454.1 hypothetical protein BDZ99DRAFT_374465 [Mytilinidion resinicola]